MDTFPAREYTLRGFFKPLFSTITMKGVIGMGFELFKISGKLAVDGIDKAKKDLDKTGDAAKETAEKTEKLTGEFEKLSYKIEHQQSKVDLLKRKYADLCLTQGKNSKEAKECAEEIENLSSELKKNRARLEDAKNAAEGYDKSLDDAGKSGKSFGDKLKDSFGKVGKAAGIVTGALVAVGTAIITLESETREYRTAMGKLDAAFTTAGHSTEAATKTYKTLQSVLGETDQAVEAANHLAKLTDNEQDLEKWTNICTGVFATFGDSLPIEGLTEAANETAKVAQVTGPLADALNWAGVSEDEFNKKLAACNTERERAALITDTLNGLYDAAAEAYRHENEAILEANAAQENWNEAVARIGALVAPAANSIKNDLANALNKAADAFDEFGEKTKNADSHLWEHTQTSEEAAAVVEDLKTQIEQLKNTDPGLWTEMHQAEYDRLRNALAGAEDNYYALLEAEAAAGEQATETASQSSTALDEFSQSVKTVLEEYQATYSAMFSQVGSWFAPFEQAKITVQTSVTDMMAAMQSQIDFNTNYAASLQSLKEYGLGALADEFQATGEAGAAYAQAIVDAVEKAGGASTEEGQKIIQDFQSLDQQVQESQSAVAEELTTLSGEFESKLGEIATKLAESVEDMDKSEEAYAAAESTFAEYLAGVESQTPGIQSAMASLGALISSTVQANITPVTVPVVQATVDGVTVNGSHADGLERVPFDNYIANLHKGEAVLTAEEAAAWRAGKASSGNMGSSAAPAQSTPQEIVTNITLELDGAVLARKLYKHNQTVSNDRGASFVRG